MNELARLAYLQAMDIDSYVSRGALPGAAPSRRLRVVRRAPAAPVPAAETCSQAPTRIPAAAELKAALAPGAAREKPVPVQVREKREPQSRSDIPIFSFAASSAGGWFWLDEIPAGRELSAAYGQLIQAICMALSLPQGDAQVELFSWPLTSGGHLDQGRDAARGAVLGYLNNRIEQCHPQGIVCLGDMDQDWFDRDCLGDRRVVSTVSAWQMMRDPSLKAQAWADLLALRGDGN